MIKEDEDEPTLFGGRGTLILSSFPLLCIKIVSPGVLCSLDMKSKFRLGRVSEEYEGKEVYGLKVKARLEWGEESGEVSFMLLCRNKRHLNRMHRTLNVFLEGNIKR